MRLKLKDKALILYQDVNYGLYDRLIYNNPDKIYCRRESTATNIIDVDERK